MSKTLDTGVKNARNVSRYVFGSGSLGMLQEMVAERRSAQDGATAFFIDEYFQDKNDFIDKLGIKNNDFCMFVATKEELSTSYVNRTYAGLMQHMADHEPCAVIGVGGGTTLDMVKAVANLITNNGRAEDYQGWDLVKKPAVYKCGISTLSGTGAEATRTCVMTNQTTGLKLGMNSDHTVFDQLILDPDLTRTVPRDQYFYSGMDAYIHCIESLSGNYRNAIGDAFSEQTIKLCREVFSSEDMMSDENRGKLMVASYLGGCAIATSYVGVLHPFSAGLSVVLGLHHCVANCIAMRAMGGFYPKEYDEFWQMVKRQGVDIPEGVCRNLADNQFESLYQATIIHEKPLTNALGKDFKLTLTRDKVVEIFERM